MGMFFTVAGGIAESANANENESCMENFYGRNKGFRTENARECVENRLDALRHVESGHMSLFLVDGHTLEIRDPYSNNLVAAVNTFTCRVLDTLSDKANPINDLDYGGKKNIKRALKDAQKGIRQNLKETERSIGQDIKNLAAAKLLPEDQHDALKGQLKQIKDFANNDCGCDMQ